MKLNSQEVQVQVLLIVMMLDNVLNHAESLENKLTDDNREKAKIAREMLDTLLFAYSTFIEKDEL